MPFYNNRVQSRYEEEKLITLKKKALKLPLMRHMFSSPICDPNLHPNSKDSVYTVYTVVIHIHMEGQT